MISFCEVVTMRENPAGFFDRATAPCFFFFALTPVTVLSACEAVFAVVVVVVVVAVVVIHFPPCSAESFLYVSVGAETSLLRISTKHM